jgi:alkanesulfonate monooxygenase SsuD/methylene tetrahydromethanopterin reductase-like flavin-dependent oxidoreductase (luciferase family)
MRFGLDIAQQRMPWDEVVGRVQFAEDLGFDGAWGFDHFQPMYGEGPGETFEGMTRHPVPVHPRAVRPARRLARDRHPALHRRRRFLRGKGYGYLVCGWPAAGRPQVERFAREVMPEFA